MFSHQGSSIVHSQVEQSGLFLYRSCMFSSGLDCDLYHNKPESCGKTENKVISLGFIIYILKNTIQ